MTNKNRAVLFLQTDEIDHLTIRYTDYGEKLNVKDAVKKIKFYYACYDDIKNALGHIDVSQNALSLLSEKELYEILVKIRTVLLDSAMML